ncbi:MAG: L-aspartate oxidase [Chlorobiaceae bacterium]|nr:L-aspartate oxidase [Chlorobiaceae bacterium]
MEIKTDVLIIGSGIAGLYSAIKISQFANVTLVTKKEKAESNTNYAQGGIAGVLDPADTFEKHIADTMIAGAGLCNKKHVEILVKEGPARIHELIEIGTEFTQKNGKLDLVREGGHSFPRIVHSSDLTGKEVERALIEKANSIKNINIIENALAMELITEHYVKNLKDKPIASRHCWGAYALNILNNQVMKIVSKVTILATGGLGQIYLHTTNPQIATGDGVAMAYRAGAKVSNMEFIQFHPTSFYNPNNSTLKQSFLISEAVRGFGGILRTTDGVAFMKKYDKREELAPRDIVARAIDFEMKKRGDDFVYLDITNKSKAELIEHFPNIYEHCLTFGIDISKDLIPVVPAAHYSCGGVLVDESARTSLNYLYAVGEVAMTGVHGANRLASNSLLEALVFSHKASENIKEFFKESESENIPPIPAWDDTGMLTADEKVLISHGTKELKQLMLDYVGIVRSNLRLTFAQRRIHNLFIEVEDFYKKTKVFDSVIELRNLITCSHLIVKSALLRKESRGLHYNIDYLEQDMSKEPTDTVLQNTYQKT